MPFLQYQKDVENQNFQIFTQRSIHRFLFHPEQPKIRTLESNLRNLFFAYDHWQQDMFKINWNSYTICTFIASIWKEELALLYISQILCYRETATGKVMLDRAMDTIYQYTYGFDKNRKIWQIIGIFHQIYTLSFFWSVYRLHQFIFMA